MLVDINKATVIAKTSYPDGKIQGVVDYDSVWLFKIFDDNPEEGTFDPFFSVDKNTGEFKEFSVMTDASPIVINLLFKAAENSK